MLFKDLAKVEQYIAESYKTRSFIELIQNADDAKSKKFGIHIFDNFVIVGNDGRDFNYDDVKAICRSGSSNKIRGGSTIGYRGIGFKSVVNLAERVYVLSGNINFMYDKGLTQNMLNITDDVPLIRIPHIAKNIPHIEEISKMKKIYNLFLVAMLAICCTSCNNEWEDEQFKQLVSFKATINGEGVSLSLIHISEPTRP